MGKNSEKISTQIDNVQAAIEEYNEEIKELNNLKEKISRMSKIEDNNTKAIFSKIAEHEGELVDCKIMFPKVGVVNIRGTLKYDGKGHKVICVDEHGEENVIIKVCNGLMRSFGPGIPFSIKNIENNNLIFTNRYYRESNEYIMNAKLFGKQIAIRAIDNAISKKQTKLKNLMISSAVKLKRSAVKKRNPSING